MRIVIMNDVHKASVPPVSRKSNYNDCINAKLKEIYDFTVDNDVEALCCTGDWFHSKNPDNIPYWLTNELAAWFFKFEIPVITALGNHDWDEKEETFNHYPLKLAMDAGAVSYRIDSGLCYDTTYHPQFEMEKKIRIFTVNSNMGDSAAKIWDVAKRGDLGYGRNDYINILIVHGPILRPDMADRYPEPFLIQMVKATDLKGVADYVFYGDIHDDHGLYRIGDTVFCNYGSISRNSYKELQRVREVSAAYLDTITGDVQRITLENVVPVSDAFRTEEIAEGKEQDENMEQFVEAIGKTEFSMLTPEAVKNRIVQDKELTDGDKKIALGAIDAVS